MKREFTCIVCPNGCPITVEIGADGSVHHMEGASCPRGEAYVRQELTDPRRTIATSLAVLGGELPLASVRLTAPIPRDQIFAVMAELRKHTLTAPVEAGTVVISRLFGSDADVIVTKSVARRGS